MWMDMDAPCLLFACILIECNCHTCQCHKQAGDAAGTQTRTGTESGAEKMGATEAATSFSGTHCTILMQKCQVVSRLNPGKLLPFHTLAWASGIIGWSRKRAGLTNFG